MRCLDCGNKAKKDCFYFRCRSCCRGHGFECQTHVKSTWVPISTRQVMRNTAAAMAASSSAQPHQEHHQQDGQQQYHPPSSSFGFGEHFPIEVSGEATFTRIQVSTSVEENAIVEQYAYESSINIGGHVFKGILYDQGPSLQIANSSDMNVHDRDQRIL
ncbi:protein EXPRESSION OF TERPENOIDS 1-like [Rutidosis leptorrhynchoides]|uniref:protein EXPRESSION OF TERPENOIDS 1-like n=1 Tax=Rutidosis leptorrhynchoides TaxID=125765 RepID=UPI003A994EB6